MKLMLLFFTIVLIICELMLSPFPFIASHLEVVFLGDQREFKTKELFSKIIPEQRFILKYWQSKQKICFQSSLRKPMISKWEFKM